jgi:hypothetical protein
MQNYLYGICFFEINVNSIFDRKISLPIYSSE